MSLSVPALTTTVNALRYQLRRMDQAAQVIAASGLKDMPEPAQADPSWYAENQPEGADSWYREPRPESQPSIGGEFTDAMVTMLKAQRAALAQLRTLEQHHQLSQEIMDQLSDPEGDGVGH